MASFSAGQGKTKPSGSVPLFRLLGPAFVAAVAYVDPGNVAANLTTGAEYGYLLVWVLVLANLMAVIVQFLSAKLGLVSGKSLPELVAEKLNRPARIAYWIQAELVAAATDLAEIIGGAIALWILFDIEVFYGGLIVGVVSLGLLMIQNRHGHRRFELTMMAFLLIIVIGFMAGLFFANVSWGQTAAGLVPKFADGRSVMLAASMLGATVMPHAIYAHSSLAIHRFGRENTDQLPRLLKATKWDVLISLLVAGSVNIAMLLLAAAALPGYEGTDTIQGAHKAIETALGSGVGVLFAVGLLASGLASTSVGSYAGAEIMSGLLKIRVPLLARRLVTMIPALIILFVGVEPTWALVLSQVALSLGIPFAIIPLVGLTGSKNLMGRWQNTIGMKIIAWGVVVLIVALNSVLVWLTFTGRA